MRRAVFMLLVLQASLACATDSYEGSWFTCVFEMAGRRNPWSVQDIRAEGGQLKVFSEWGTQYSFSGTAHVNGHELVIRGCSYYVDKPMENCDPKAPPVTGGLKLPLGKGRPVQLDSALKQGVSIFVESPQHLEQLSSRCEKLIEVQEKAKQ